MSKYFTKHKITKRELNPKLINKGNLVIEGKGEINELIVSLENQRLDGIGLITLVDNAIFVSENFSNWLWVTFTRSNPANDIYGLTAKTNNKHFSCSLPIIIGVSFLIIPAFSFAIFLMVFPSKLV